MLWFTFGFLLVFSLIVWFRFFLEILGGNFISRDSVGNSGVCIRKGILNDLS